MLKEIQESEELQYLVNNSNPQKGSSDGHSKNTGNHDKRNYKHGHSSYQAWAVNVQEEPEEYWSDSLSDVKTDSEMDDVQKDSSYIIGVTNMADEVEGFFRKCYNCSEEGHPWRYCKKLMKPSLKLALKSENDQKARWGEKKQLNQTRGTGAKGGSISEAGMGKAIPAPAKN